MNIETIDNAVTIIDGRPTTTSLKVAKIFGKRHDNVLRDIERLECSPEFNRLNFEETQFERKTPTGGIVKSKAYNITKDGFVFLCMGYTGKKAAQFKEAYINTFNAMAAELRRVANERVSMEAVKSIADNYGYEWILDRLQKCELLEAYEPHVAHNTIDERGFHGTVRRGANPVRGGRKLSSLLGVAQHPDLFVITSLRQLDGYITL